MRMGNKGLALIKKFEGCKLEAYICPAGVITIGYGHTKTADKGMVIDQQEADRLLAYDLSEFERGVESLVQVDVTQNQFDALVSFAFNLGLGALAKSTLLKKVNARDVNGAAQEFLKWNKAGGKVLTGLVRRREAERELFLS